MRWSSRKSRSAAAEDKILELMLALENEEKALKVAEAELKTESADVEREKAEARVRTAEDEKLLAGLKEKRARAAHRRE